MPTVSEYDVFKSASPAVQENMTYYFNQSASLRSWSAVSVEGSASLSPVFGEIFGEGQGKNFTYLTYLYMFKKQYPASRGVSLAWQHLQLSFAWLVNHLDGLFISLTELGLKNAKSHARKKPLLTDEIEISFFQDKTKF